MTENVRCPECNLWVAPDMLVDVSRAPDELTRGLKEACTGSLDGWYRQGRTINGRAVTRADIHEAVGGEKIISKHPYWNRRANEKN